MPTNPSKNPPGNSQYNQPNSFDFSPVPVVEPRGNRQLADVKPEGTVTIQPATFPVRGERAQLAQYLRESMRDFLPAELQMEQLWGETGMK